MAADPRSASLLTQQQQPSSAEWTGYGTSQKRPPSPRLGFLYFDTTLNLEVVFTNVGWRTVGVAAISMVGVGTTAQRPANPQPGFTYFDTTLQQQITWNGSAFVVIGPFATTASAVGYGPTGSRPASPANGFLYFDTTLQQEIVWTGSAWIPIGPSTSGAAPVITSPPTAAAVANSPFSYRITATNSPTGYGASGLPAGLSVDIVTGIISGVPTVVGSTGATISATNGTGTTNGPLTITVAAASAAPVITSATTASVTQGTAFSYQITATNSPSSFGAIGTLPTGVTLNSVTGLISGTPYGSGSFSVTVTATNGAGTGSGPLTITVAASSVPSATFRGISGIALCDPTKPVIVGGILNSSSAGILTVAVRVATGGQFPPGVTYQLVSPGGVIVQSGTTSGGESNINFSSNVALQGGYTVVVSTSSASFIPEVGMVISGTPQFVNGSLRATVVGTPLAPPDGFDMALFITQIDPSTQVKYAQFSEGTTNALRQPPNFGWSFEGDTTSNPKTAWATGLTQIQLTGETSAPDVSESRLEVNFS